MTTHFRVITALWTLCGLVVFGAAARAQSPALQVGAAASTYEIHKTISATVTGVDVYDVTPTIKVYDNLTEITSSVTVTLLDESMEDSNEDGLLEDYTGQFSVDLGSYQLAPGHLLIVSASTTCPGGTTRAASSTKVKSNVAVTVDSKIEEGSTAVHVAMVVDETDVDSQTLTVTFEGSDVTSLVGITGPDLKYETKEGTNPEIVRNRVEVYTLDLSALTVTTTGILEVTSTVTNVESRTSTRTTTAVVVASGAPTLTPCQQTALNNFCAALSLTKNSSSQTSVGATAAQAKAAADAFQAENELCSPKIGSQAVNATYTAAGQTYTVRLVIKNGDATVSAPKDLTIAIAGDGSGSASGGDATATNTQAGGAAIAIGGDGGSGASSAGNGGSGTATATPPGGHALGVGGTGGTPSNVNTAGGMGGAGQGNVGTTQNGTGGTSGTAGTPGTHGGYGWGNSTNGSGTAGSVPPAANT